MKICRLKIIRANILSDNIDTPYITYVSQSQNKKNTKEDLYESKQKIYNEEKNELVDNIEEIILSKESANENIKLQDIIKSDREQDNKEEKEEKEEKENNEKKEDINNIIVENSIKNEESKNNQNVLKSSYPYAIMNKRKDLNNSLRFIFKNRLTKDKTHSTKNTFDKKFKFKFA